MKKGKAITSALVMSATLSVLVSGCGSKAPQSTTGQPNSSNSSSNSTVSNSSTNNSSNVSGTQGTGSSPVTITWITTYKQAQVKPVIDAFEKQNPNIKVKAQVVPFNNYFPTVMADMKAKSSSVDILSVDAPEVASYTVRKWLLPLDKYVSKQQLSSSLTAAALKSCYYKGSLTALPQFSSSHMLYYNKKLFKAANITPPSMNDAWTWEHVTQVAKQLNQTKNGTTSVYGLLFEQVNRPYELLPLSESLGADPLNFESKGWLKAMQWYYNVFNTWKLSNNNVNVTQKLFASGKAAIFIGGEWDAPILAKQDPNLSFGYAPYPYFQGGSKAIPTGSWHDGISVYSKHVAADVKFLKFITLGQGAKIDFTPEAAGNLPALKSLLYQIQSSPKFSKPPLSVYKLAAQEAQYTVPRPVTPYWDAYQTIATKMYTDISTGTQPKAALQAAESQWKKATSGY